MNRALVTRRIPDAGLELLRQHCEVILNEEDRPLTREELLRGVAGVDGVLCLLTDRIDGEVMGTARAAKGFANFAVGFDNIDVPEATRRGLPVSNTPGVLTDATAEMAWCLLFAVARRIVESDAVMRSGRWPGWGPLQFLGGDVTGRTLGVVGAGRIGQAFAMKSRGFEMPVLYADECPSETLERELGARRVDLETLLREADFVSIHVPLAPATRHLVDARALRSMKRTAYLINTSRGPVVDERALVEALQEGVIAGAGLDVYEDEPRMAPGLAGLANVVLAPHTASATITSRNNMALTAVRNLIAMMAGAKAPNCLNPQVYERH